MKYLRLSPFGDIERVLNQQDSTASLTEVSDEFGAQAIALLVHREPRQRPRWIDGEVTSIAIEAAKGVRLYFGGPEGWQKSPLPPLTLTPRQARLWLLSNGIGDAVIQAQIDAIADATEREAARIEWEYATEVKSDHPLVLTIAAALNLNATQIRAAFTTGASL